MALSAANHTVSYHYCGGVHLVSVFCLSLKMSHLFSGPNYTSLKSPISYQEVSYGLNFATPSIVHVAPSLFFWRLSGCSVNICCYFQTLKCRPNRLLGETKPNLKYECWVPATAMCKGISCGLRASISAQVWNGVIKPAGSTYFCLI